MITIVQVDKLKSNVLSLICIMGVFCLLIASPAFANPKTVYVQPYKQAAVGVAPMLTLLVSTNPAYQNVATPFFGSIKGFNYEWGYNYTLNVNEVSVENAPADASSVSWELIEVVAKTPVPAGTEFSMRILPSMLNDKGDGIYSLYNEKDVVLRVNAPGDCGAPSGNDPVYATFIFPASASDPLILKDWGVSIDGVSWSVQTIDGIDVSSFNASLEFKDNGISGFGGVNRFFGPAQIQGLSGWLKIGPLGSTMMAGSPEAMRAEQNLYAALDQVSYFNTNGPQLILGGDNHTIWLVPASTLLLGKEWQLVKMGNTDINPADNVSLVLSSEGANGASFVNYFNGTYNLEGNKLKFGLIGTTKMMGEPEEMELEYAYLDMMKKVALWKLGHGMLSLLDINGEILLQYVEAPKPMDITKTIWQLTWMGEPLITDVTLAFHENGFGGPSFVNRYNGTYTLTDNILTFGEIITTKMMGSPEKMKLEYAYLDLLRKVTQYAVQDNELVLLNADNEALLKFNPLVVEPQVTATPDAVTVDATPAIEDEIIPAEIRPVYRDGVWYVGFRTLFAWMGAEIRYHKATDTAQAVWGGRWASAAVGAMTARVGESRITLDGRVIRINEKIMVPLTFISRASDIETEVVIENGVATKIKAKYGNKTGYIPLN